MMSSENHFALFGIMLIGISPRYNASMEPTPANTHALGEMPEIGAENTSLTTRKAGPA
jgi:hypothetical protein